MDTNSTNIIFVKLVESGLTIKDALPAIWTCTGAFLAGMSGILLEKYRQNKAHKRDESHMFAVIKIVLNRIENSLHAIHENPNDYITNLLMYEAICDSLETINNFKIKYLTLLEPHIAKDFHNNCLYIKMKTPEIKKYLELIKLAHEQRTRHHDETETIISTKLQRCTKDCLKTSRKMLRTIN